MKKILTLALIILLTGCTTYWARPNTSSEQANGDIYQCQMQVANTYPVSMMQSTVGAGYQAPSRTICQTSYGQTNCTTYPGAYTPPSTMNIDVNAGARKEAFSHCMMAKGYTASSDQYQRSPEPTKYSSENFPNYKEVCFQNCRANNGEADVCKSQCNYQ